MGNKRKGILHNPLSTSQGRILALILLFAALLRLQRVIFRWNQIALAYSSYFYEYLKGLKSFDLPSITGRFVGLHPPLYSLSFSLTFITAGSPFSLFLLSLAFSLLAILFTFRTGMILFGKGAALLSSLVMASSVYLVVYSLEINNYPLFVFTTALAHYTFARTFMRGEGRIFPLFILSSALLAYSHILGACLFLSQFLFLLLFERRALKRWGSGMAVTSLLSLPLLPGVVELLRRQGTYHNEPPGGLIATLSGQWDAFLHRFGHPSSSILLLLLLLAGILSTHSSRGRSFRKKGAYLSLNIVTAAATILTAHSLGVTAAHQFPYYLFLMPAVSLLTAGGYHVAGKGVKGLALSMIIIVAIINTVHLQREFAKGIRTFSEYRAGGGGIHIPLSEWSEGDALFLIAPPLFLDDDKSGLDRVYSALSPFERLTFFKPEEIDFEFIDFTFGQPVRYRGGVLHTFTDVYPVGMEIMMRYHLDRGNRVFIYLYDLRAAPSLYTAMVRVVEGMEGVSLSKFLRARDEAVLMVEKEDR